jgi:hypothetical protein
MKERGFPASEQEAFAELIGKMAPVLDLRNLLAHGHLYGRYIAEKRCFTVVVSPARDLDVAYLPEARSADFAEIQSALLLLEDLQAPLSRLAGFPPIPDPHP